MHQPNPALPLAGHVLFQSNDLDEARDRVARVFCPHRLETIGRGAQMAARHHHLRGERISLNYIEYGAKTRIAPGELSGFYLLQIPIVGGASIVNGSDRYQSNPMAAAVLNPHLPTSMVWEEGTKQVLVQLDRKAMQDHLSAHLGARAERPVAFTGALDLTTASGMALRRLVLCLIAEADAGVVPIGAGMMAKHIEAAVISGLLEAGQHDYAGPLARSRDSFRPRNLRLAEGFIEAHLEQPLSIDDIAQIAGVTPRALQMAFQKYHGLTPLQFVRTKRLERAHQDLQAGSTSVTEAAMRWGFSHFGRFSAFYRQHYGVVPSKTGGRH